MSRLICITVNVLLGCSCTLLMLLAVPRLVGLECYTVVSGSMEPALPVGSAVYVKRMSFSDISKGDVITYVIGESGMRVTHRVVETDEKKQQFVTKGDANECVDGKTVSFQNVCGVVKFYLPLLGYLQKFLANDKGKRAAVSTLLGLFLMSELLEKDKIRKKVFADNEG